MLKEKKIKVEKKFIQAYAIKLSAKYLILLKGSKGFVMCGYLDLVVADKFNDVAVKIIGVSSIKQALETQARSVSQAAQALGISPGQPIKEVLKIIA